MLDAFMHTDKKITARSRLRFSFQDNQLPKRNMAFRLLILCVETAHMRYLQLAAYTMPVLEAGSSAG